MRIQKSSTEIPLVHGASYSIAKGESPSGHVSNSEKIRRPEIELLVCCATTELYDPARIRIAEILNSPLDWNEVINRAAEHAIVPLVGRNLKQYSELIPLEVLERLRVLVYRTNIHNLHLASELTRLTNLMDENGIISLPFKGPVLATEMYGDLARRQFSDLDILVLKKDFQRVKDLLLRNGLVPLVGRTLAQEAAYLNAQRRYNYKLISTDGRVRVELHWKFTSKYNSFSVDYDQLFRRLIRISFGGHKVHHLQPEDLLLILSQHGSKHFWTRLLWVVDIVEVLRRHPEINWQKTITRAESMGIRRMLFLALHLAEQLFDLKLPAHVANRIRKERRVKVLAARIHRQLLCESDPIAGFEKHTFSCAMRERLRDKARYAGYHTLAHLTKAATFSRVRPSSRQPQHFADIATPSNSTIVPHD